MKSLWVVNDESNATTGELESFLDRMIQKQRRGSSMMSLALIYRSYTEAQMGRPR